MRLLAAEANYWLLYTTDPIESRILPYAMDPVSGSRVSTTLPHQKTRVAVGPSGGQYRVDFFGVSDSDPSTV